MKLNPTIAVLAVFGAADCIVLAGMALRRVPGAVRRVRMWRKWRRIVARRPDWRGVA